jgi:type VI protein secretion system component VasK
VAGAQVVGCGSVQQAPDRLNALAGPASPLLALFYTVSHNTAVANKQIKDTFQPAQALVDPNAADHWIGPGNKGYLDALLALSAALDVASKAPASDPNAFSQVTTSVSLAGVAAQQAAQSFNVDPQFQTEKKVQSLLQTPIACAGGLVPSPGAPANGGGKKICDAVTKLNAKYPFSKNPDASQATVADVNAVFAPDSGAIWSIYAAALKPDVALAGSRYVQAPNAAGTVNPKFLDFFNHAADISALLYPNGVKSPTFNFTLRFIPGGGVTTAALVVDGKRITSGQQFQWNADTAQSALLDYDSNQVLKSPGVWSLFQLVATGKPTRSGAGIRIDYPLAMTIAGQQVGQSGATGKKVSFEIDGPGAEILTPGFLSSGPGCTSTVILK